MSFKKRLDHLTSYLPNALTGLLFISVMLCHHASAQQSAPVSAELTANLSHQRSGAQSQPAVTALKRGGFVIAWKDEVEANGSTGGGDIKAATFDAQGNRISSGTPMSAFGDYQINTLVTNGRQENPAVADISQMIQAPLCISTPRGMTCVDSWYDRIVFAWTDASPINTNQSEDVRGAIWNPMQSPLRSLRQVVPDFPISADPGKQNVPAVVDIGYGSFFCAFSDEGKISTSTGQDEHDSGVIAKIGSSIGNLQAPVLINPTDTPDGQSEVSLASGAGGLLISWTDADQIGTGKGINGSNYSLGPVGPFTVCMMGGPCASLETPINQIKQNTQEKSDSAPVAGRFVTVWQDDSAILHDTDILGNFVPNIGGLPDFVINEVPDGNQSDPAIAELHVGTASVGFVAVWISNATSGPFPTGTDEVIARVFDTAGTAMGPSFRVNSNTARSQSEPDVAGLDDGRFVVVWSDDCSDCNSGDIKYRVFRSPFSHP